MTVQAAPQAPGLCQFCRCTEEEPCRLEAGEECGWLDKDRTTCTNPKCRIALQQMKRDGKAATELRRRERKAEIAQRLGKHETERRKQQQRVADRRRRAKKKARAA